MLLLVVIVTILVVMLVLILVIVIAIIIDLCQNTTERCLPFLGCVSSVCFLTLSQSLFFMLGGLQMGPSHLQGQLWAGTHQPLHKHEFSPFPVLLPRALLHAARSFTAAWWSFPSSVACARAHSGARKGRASRWGLPFLLPWGTRRLDVCKVL